MDCGICFKDVDTFDGIELDCKHCFHIMCLEKWKMTCVFNNVPASCPFCRSTKLIPVIHIDTKPILPLHRKDHPQYQVKISRQDDREQRIKQRKKKV
jgi:hypothetical protein